MRPTQRNDNLKSYILKEYNLLGGDEGAAEKTATETQRHGEKNIEFQKSLSLGVSVADIFVF